MMLYRRWTVAFFAAFLWFCLAELTPAVAQQDEAAPPDQQDTAASDPLPGHSSHGAAFNEGPRQQAYLMEGTGQVYFPVTTADPRAQQFINQGIGQLHGFWYFEAERSFRQAAAIDPHCAMAYWGAAMANVGNEERAKGFISKALDRKEKVSAREALYIDGLNALLHADKKDKKQRLRDYVKSLERIVYDYPDDLEAKSLLALQLWKNENEGIPLGSHLAVDALLDQVFAEQPMHPAHHYRIHLWDRERPEKAVASAALCGPAAPAIAHMWHMPGHIHWRLKRYHDAAWQQEASARVDHAHMMRDRVLPDQIHNFAHNNEWLVRSLNHVGRVHDAVALAKNMIELPRHPKYNTLSKRGSTYYGRLRLVETLARYEMWPELVALADSPYLHATDEPLERIDRAGWLGKAYFRNQQEAEGEQQLAQMQQMLAEETAARKKAEQEAVEKAKQQDGASDKKIKQARRDARKPYRQRIEKLQQVVQKLEGYRALARGDYEQALKQLQKLSAVDPIDKARVQLLAGEPKAAIDRAREHVAQHEHEVQPLAALAELLWQAGEKSAALEALQQLRSIASSADLDVPLLARLEPLVNAAELPKDWRLPAAPQEDLGQRPPLEQLGPFRWQPTTAPDFSLPDAKGQLHTLKQYQGRPLVLIFYLGYGCLHCAEQLQEFAPLASRFNEAGMLLLAISSDQQQDLKQSLRDYTQESFPMTLLANPTLESFRAYRAYDDFEEQPLHGTFLIDAEGRLRWQDVSYEPFMDAEFLLKESQRLLSKPDAAGGIASRGSGP